MTHVILIHGKRLDPKDAAKTLLPNDTWLACPNCESRMVQAVAPQLTLQFKDESKRSVPRMQDRWCLDCGHRWATVLPPQFVAEQHPLPVPATQSPLVRS